MKQKVPVGGLHFGMYVAELDRPWTETPFTFQGFVLRSQQQLDALKKYCTFVWVDFDRSETVGRMPAAAPLDLSGTGKVKHREQLPVEHEFAKAAEAHKTGESVMVDLLGALRAGRTLDAARVSEAVNGLTDSVLRNPDAMLLFTQLKSKDDYTQSHALDVSVYMMAFGRFLEMSRQDIALLGHLGLLQDIGKTRLPDALLAKRERLSQEEIAAVRQHVEHSVEILRKTEGLPPSLADLAGLHHERVDGSGYPRGLKGNQVGLMGSIAGLVDVFDALTARRPYAEPMAPSMALSTVYKWRGSLFDASLVEQFIRCIGIFPVGSVVELDTGEIGIVIAQNLEKRLQPRIMLFRDAEQKPIKPEKLVDLARAQGPGGHPYRIRKTLEYGRVTVNADSIFRF